MSALLTTTTNRYSSDSGSSISSNLTDDTKTSLAASLDTASFSWVAWFCSLKGNAMLCQVDRSYLEDSFNFAGLEELVPCFAQAMDIILDVQQDSGFTTDSIDRMSEDQRDIIESAAELLYGLVHQRFILSTRGLKRMYDKYKACGFGRCHRVYCRGQPVLPVGQSDLPGKTTVNVYCPRCKDIYFPQVASDGNIDGAFFGTSFPSLFLLRYPNLVPSLPVETFVPRIYGFKVHYSSPLNK